MFMAAICNAPATMDAELFSKFVQAVMNQLLPVAKDANPHNIRSLIENPARLRGRLKKLFPTETFIIFVGSFCVNYGISVEEAMRLGNCYRSNPYISSASFPPQRRGIVELQVGLIRSSRPLSTKMILRMIGEEGCRPAELLETLPIGSVPDIPREFPIAVLGSVWKVPSSHHRVPILYANNPGWDVDLETIDEKVWPPNMQFAVVAE